MAQNFVNWLISYDQDTAQLNMYVTPKTVSKQKAKSKPKCIICLVVTTCQMEDYCIIMGIKSFGYSQVMCYIVLKFQFFILILLHGSMSFDKTHSHGYVHIGNVILWNHFDVQ